LVDELEPEEGFNIPSGGDNLYRFLQVPILHGFADRVGLATLFCKPDTITQVPIPNSYGIDTVNNDERNFAGFA